MYVRKHEVKKLLKHGVNDCMYSPVKPNTIQLKEETISITSPHEYCNHTHYCIFNNKRTQLEQEILLLEKELEDFEKIKNAAINGEIIYHKKLNSYYDISISRYTGTDGKTHYKTDVKLTDKFMGGLNREIKNLKYDLRNLINFRLDVIHGKINGYGYGDTDGVFEC